MSTELGILETVLDGEVMLTRLWGGRAGWCIQLTPSYGETFITLSAENILKLVPVLIKVAGDELTQRVRVIDNG